MNMHSDEHDHSSPAAPPPPPAKPKPGAVVIGFLVLLVGEILVLSNAGVKFPDIQPRNIGTFHIVDTLFYVILAVTGFFFFLTQGLLVYFLLRYRARPGGKAVHTHGSHALELAWTFIPGLILFALAVFQTGSWGSMKYTREFPDEKDAVVIQVFAKQFEWHFRYAGADGVFGTADDVTKLADMHVPVNRDIIVKLRTRDVLHSFWLPNVRVKQDLLPGLTIPQWFHVTETGTDFEIVCAELCGIGHTTMRGRLIVETEAEFQAWLKKQHETMGDHDPEEDSMWKYWQEGLRK